MVDVALVVGVEKFSDQIGASVEAALATGGDSDYETVQGVTPTIQAALLMRRYLHEFDLPRSALAGFPHGSACKRRWQPACHVPQADQPRSL